LQRTQQSIQGPIRPQQRDLQDAALDGNWVNTEQWCTLPGEARARGEHTVGALEHLTFFDTTQGHDDGAERGARESLTQKRHRQRLASPALLDFVRLRIDQLVRNLGERREFSKP
jgi:hypothetical protein